MGHVLCGIWGVWGGGIYKREVLVFVSTMPVCWNPVGILNQDARANEKNRYASVYFLLNSLTNSITHFCQSGEIFNWCCFQLFVEEINFDAICAGFSVALYFLHLRLLFCIMLTIHL